LAQQTSPAQAEILQNHVLTEAQALSGADAKIWQQILADGENAKAEMKKASGAVASGSGESPGAAWVRYAESNLKDPLFTDFKSALEGAATSASANSGNQAWTVFSNVTQLAEQLLSRLKEIHDLRLKTSAAPAKS
jgi:hypothetical protein